ncbi:hypothetical protein ABIE67_010043 [Streptomyces sp. V4I8]
MPCLLCDPSVVQPLCSPEWRVPVPSSARSFLDTVWSARCAIPWSAGRRRTTGGQKHAVDTCSAQHMIDRPWACGERRLFADSRSPFATSLRHSMRQRRESGGQRLTHERRTCGPRGIQRSGCAVRECQGWCLRAHTPVIAHGGAACCPGLPGQVTPPRDGVTWPWQGTASVMSACSTVTLSYRSQGSLAVSGPRRPGPRRVPETAHKVRRSAVVAHGCRSVMTQATPLCRSLRASCRFPGPSCRSLRASCRSPRGQGHFPQAWCRSRWMNRPA